MSEPELPTEAPLRALHMACVKILLMPPGEGLLRRRCRLCRLLLYAHRIW